MAALTRGASCTTDSVARPPNLHSSSGSNAESRNPGGKSAEWMSSQYEYPSITFDASSRQSAELMFFPPTDGLTGSIVRLSLSAMSLLERDYFNNEKSKKCIQVIFWYCNIHCRLSIVIFFGDPAISGDSDSSQSDKVKPACSSAGTCWSPCRRRCLLTHMKVGMERQ